MGRWLETRYPFTVPYLAGARVQTASARLVELKPVEDVGESDMTAHRSYVVAAVMQAAAALESQAWELANYGPGAPVGSNDVDYNARALLGPLAGMIDQQPTLERFDIALHLMGRNRLSRGEQPWQDAQLVVRLRNELVHYKSYFESDLDDKRLLIALEAKRLPKPPFVSDNIAGGFFPHKCLSASTAEWACDACVAFLDDFYARLGYPSPLTQFRGIVDR